MAENHKSKAISVCFRARPLNRREKRRREKSVVRAGGFTEDGSAMVVLDANPNVNELDVQSLSRDTMKMYACDHFFDESSSTTSVYEKTAANLIPRLFEGKNGSAFCYGATGTGKTFTMFGDNKSSGIVRLVGSEIFEQLEENEGSRVESRLRLSGIEIYGETIRDLLDDSNGETVRITSSKRGKSVIQGLSAKVVENLEQFNDMVQYCRNARVTEATNANDTSSRSHCIIQITLEQRNQVTGERKESKLNLIDLAGSERATVTDTDGRRRSKSICDPAKKKRKKKKRSSLMPRKGSVHRRSQTVPRLTSSKSLPRPELQPRSQSVERPLKSRLGECQDINSSLLALKQCIRSLVQKKKFIPWRNSKLTRLLEDTLAGTGSAYMIVCISKGSAQWMATKDTLEYGTQARMIKVSAKSEKKAKRMGTRVLKKQLVESQQRCDRLWQEKQDLLAKIEQLQKLCEWKDLCIDQLKESVDAECLPLPPVARSVHSSRSRTNLSASDGEDEYLEPMNLNIQVDHSW